MRSYKGDTGPVSCSEGPGSLTIPSLLDNLNERARSSFGICRTSTISLLCLLYLPVRSLHTTLRSSTISLREIRHAAIKKATAPPATADHLTYNAPLTSIDTAGAASTITHATVAAITALLHLYFRTTIVHFFPRPRGWAPRYASFSWAILLWV